MKRHSIVLAIALITLFGLNASTSFAATETSSNVKNVNTILIHADANKVTISPEIYGHFAEHLGRCVYEGFWVGPNSTIPNTRGIRNDVVEALKKINVPVIRWPGGCFAD